MSRTTQFIGLNHRAWEFVSQLEKVDSDTHTMGMFGEVIHLRKWKSEGSVLEDCVAIREVVQATPWSSGPVIFTCLEAEHQNGTKCKFLEWVADPRIKNQEYDTKEGIFWI